MEEEPEDIENTESIDNTEYILYKDLKIDPILFTQGFVPGCDMKICGGVCCNWGVYLDRDFEPEIMKYEDKIKEVMDEQQPKDSTTWFMKELEEDSDFPSGYASGTELFITNKGITKCVFNDDKGYCSLQVMAMKNNLHKWTIKPKYCVMYPITIIDNILTLDNDHSLKLDYCGIHHPENYTQTVFEAMTDELKYIVGEEGYDYLNKIYEKDYKNKYEIQINKT